MLRVTGAYLSSSLGLCQNGRCLHRYWQMEKVEEQIPSWRIVVLCAETSTEPRLCARSLQYMLCMASSVRRDVSPATPLRTGSISRDAVSDGLRNRFFADAQNDREGVLYQILRFAQNDRTMFRTTVCQGSEYSVPVLRRTVRTD